MATLRLRPRFRLRVGLDPDEVMRRFEERIAAGDLPCNLELYEHQVEFSILESDRHFWSPFLNLIVESGRGQTHLRGKYGPNVNVWSMFLAAYAALGIGGTIGLILGMSQLQLDQSPDGLWISAGCAVAAVVVYGIGRIGRSLAHPQMIVFHEFVERVFGDSIVEIDDDEHK